MAIDDFKDSNSCLSDDEVEEFWRLTVYGKVRQMAFDIERMPQHLKRDFKYGRRLRAAFDEFLIGLPRSTDPWRPVSWRVLNSDEWIDALQCTYYEFCRLPEDQQTEIKGLGDLVRFLRDFLTEVYTDPGERS
jgi:hypothetical protein